MKPPLDSRQLSAFSILARTGSFTQTARELFLTQSAVSHAMKALEGDVGCRLLDRVSKRVTLTQAGEHLLQHATRILQEMEAARAGLEQLGRWGHGRLRLGVPTTLCTLLLPPVLREFKESFPQSTISVEPGDTSESVRLVEQKRVDLALALELKPDDRFDFIPLFGDEMLFITSPLHPWAARGSAPRAEVPRQNVIIYGKGSHTWRLIDGYFRAEDLVLNTVIELRSMEAIKELVKLNLGVSVLARWVVQRELAEGSLGALPLGRRKLLRQWGILHWRNRRLTMAEETFIGLCRSATENL